MQPGFRRIGVDQPLAQQLSRDFLRGPQGGANDSGDIAARHLAAKKDFPQHEGRSPWKRLCGLSAIRIAGDPIQQPVQFQQI